MLWYTSHIRCNMDMDNHGGVCCVNSNQRTTGQSGNPEADLASWSFNQ